MTTWLEAVIVAAAVAFPAYVYLAWLLRQNDFTSLASMQNTIKSMQSTMEAQSNEIGELRAMREDDLRQTERLRAETAYYRTEQGYATEILLTLVAQMEALGIEPEARLDPHRRLPAVPGGSPPPVPEPVVRFIAKIAGAFNMEELAELAMMVEEDLENIQGTTKKAKVNGLVRRAERLGKLAGLQASARDLRPQVTWD